MLKVWGRTNSVNVKKALWAIEELGLKYERIDAGLQFGVNKTPEYLKMDHSVVRGLFGKFNPSHGDLVFNKSGELLGVMAGVRREDRGACG